MSKVTTSGGGLASRLRRLQVIIFWTLVGFSFDSRAQVVWNFGSTTPGTTAPTSGTPIANLTIAGITNGAIATTSGSGTSYTNSSAGCNIGFTASGGSLNTATSSFFDFSIIPANGYSYLITGISFGSRSTGTGPQSFSLRNSLDGYANEIRSGSALTNSSWALINLGALSLASSSSNNFRIYGYGGSGSGSGNWRVDDVRVTVVAVSGPVVYAEGTLNSFSTTAGTSSIDQAFVVSGFNLTNDLTVTPPAGMEIRTSGSYSTSPIAISPISGTVSNTSVSIRIAATTPATNSLSGNVTVASRGATNKTLAVSGTVSPDSTPFVSVTPSSLPAFASFSGSVSSAQSFTATAKNLTNVFTVTAPAGFQVSTNSVDFADSLTLSQTNGLSTNTVSVRVAGTNNAGSLSGNVLLASSGASSVNVGVTAAVTNPGITVTLNPALMFENSTSTGTVTLPVSRIADLTINLSSGTPAAATVPTSVTLSAGQTSVNFTATGVPDAGYAERSSVITASAVNCTNGTATLTVLNSDIPPVSPISLDGSNGNSYSQNFNSLGTNPISKVLPGSNGVIVSLGPVVSSNLNGWAVAKIAPTNTITVAVDLLASDGTTNTGTVYSFGQANGVDRALGSIATGNYTPAFGALIKNDTGGTITNVKISFTAEFWRHAIPSSGTSSVETNVLVFGYGKIDGISNTVTNFLNSANASSQTNLNITGPAPLTFGATPVNLDGTLPANQAAFSNVNIPLSLSAGEQAFIRWQDRDNTGLDTGFAIDNFSLTYDVDTSLQFTSFSPSAGTEGATVSIRGSNFTTNTMVSFNGTAATSVTRLSSSELSVVVPAGASSGLITLSQGGSVLSSPLVFIVGNFSVQPPGNFPNTTIGTSSEGIPLGISGGGLPGETLTLTSDSPEFLLSTDYVNWSSTLEIQTPTGTFDPFSNFIYMQFTPSTTGARQANLTLTSGGSLVGGFVLKGTGVGLAQPRLIYAYGGNSQAVMAWTNSAPFTNLVLLGRENAATGSPGAAENFSGVTNNFAFAPIASNGSSVLFTGDSGITNLVVTGLSNLRFYYLAIFNREGGNVSVGSALRVMPYADLSNRITQWNFNNSDLNPNLGSGTASVVGGVTAGFVNGLSGSSDRSGTNKAASVKGSSGQFTGMQFAVSTLGKKEIRVYWDVGASGSASKYTKFQYTLDVTTGTPTWVDYLPSPANSPGVTPLGGLYPVDQPDVALLQRSADLSAISGAENNPKLGFRIITANGPGTNVIVRADGTAAAYGTTGTVKYDMITVTGVDGIFGTPLSNYIEGFGLSGASALGTADPDGDGMDNNTEFAFGTSPVSGSSRAATMTTSAGSIKLTWLQRSEVTYTVKSLPDLATAFDSGTSVTTSVTSPQPTGLPSGYTQYEANVSMGPSRAFLRIRAMQP